jgi:hypothetical protein
MKVVKVLLAAFVLLFVIHTISVMHKASQEEVASHAQQVQSAQQTRPHDLELLKRSTVRAACTKHPDWAMETCQTMDQKHVSMGMTAEQVRLSWGKPEKVNATITSRTNHEQWVYGNQYVYIENNVVTSMQTPR